MEYPISLYFKITRLYKLKNIILNLLNFFFNLLLKKEMLRLTKMKFSQKITVFAST